MIASVVTPIALIAVFARRHTDPYRGSVSVMVPPGSGPFGHNRAGQGFVTRRSYEPYLLIVEANGLDRM